MNIILYPA